MKKRNWILMFITILAFLGLQPLNVKANTTNDQEAFILEIKDEAIKSYKKFNILPSLTISQAILESSWGKSSLSKNGNNLFGIKAYNDWSGPIISIATKEYIKGSYVYINANFKAYSSFNESIRDHSKLLSTDRYKSVTSASNYQEACIAIYNCGYATAPNYSHALVNIIETYNLYEYDVMPVEPTQEEPKSPNLSAKVIPQAEKVIINFDTGIEDNTDVSEDNINHDIVPFFRSDNWYIIHSMIYKTSPYSF
ncbi:MAG: glycoside hydrolase family 73 protein [Clostridiales bacterium]|nr:glycoside hydrolase family 73 protein [Clostridiales bacterium]